MFKAFESSNDALLLFKQSLRDRGLQIIETKDIRVSAGRGRTVVQQQIWTATREIYHIKFWTDKWYPKDSSKVSEFAKPLDERLKYAIKQFGKGDASASGLNEGTLLDLLNFGEQGYETYLLTMYKNGEVYFCRADQLQKFATQYGLIPQFSDTYGEPFVWVPTGWFSTFQQLIIAPPAIIDE